MTKRRKQNDVLCCGQNEAGTCTVAYGKQHLQLLCGAIAEKTKTIKNKKKQRKNKQKQKNTYFPYYIRGFTIIPK